MSKAVLISIRPNWCELIASGEKTIEVRKTQPKMETPFKCYIYCTKAPERLIGILKDGDENYGEIYHGKPVFIKMDKDSVCDMWGKRQKVIGEFVCDRIYKIDKDSTDFFFTFGDSSVYKREAEEKDSLRTAIPDADLLDYLDGRQGYGWHISNLKIYDTPRELVAFHRACDMKRSVCEACKLFCERKDLCFGDGTMQITRPPQSWGYVEELP